MGKRDKKPNHRRQKGTFSNDEEDFYDQPPPVVASVDDEDEENSEVEEEENEGNESSDLPSKFLLYQQSVQVIANCTLSLLDSIDWFLLVL